MRNLSFHEIARNPYESAAPELYPAHAWIPALGNQGKTVFNIADPILRGNLISGTWRHGSLLFNSADYFEVLNSESELNFGIADSFSIVSSVVRTNNITNGYICGKYAASGATTPMYSLGIEETTLRFRVRTISSTQILAAVATPNNYLLLNQPVVVSGVKDVYTGRLYVNGAQVAESTNAIVKSKPSLPTPSFPSVAER
jgi:hypothetical protein